MPIINILELSLWEYLFWTWLFSMFIGVILLFPAWFLLSCFLPKKLLKTYFKEPHFTAGELIIQSGWPFTMHRFMFFAGCICFKNTRYGKKRKIYAIDVYNDSPAWFRVSCQTLVFSLFLFITLFIGLMPILFILEPPAH